MATSQRSTAAKTPHCTVPFDIIRYFSALPQTGRINEAKILSVLGNPGIDGVSRRSGNVADNYTLLAQYFIKREDFPAFGFPTTAALMQLPSSSASPGSGR